jgi:hypothetical protein
MSREEYKVIRRLRELGERAKAEGRLVDVEEFAEIIGQEDAERQQVAPEALTLTPGQLRAVIKELRDRGRSEITLADLLDRLRVGPLQRPAREYIDFAATEEGVSDGVLSMLESSPRSRTGLAPFFKSWVSYSPLLDHALVRRGWARTFCRLGVHLFDQYYSLERGARLYCDACGWEVALRDPGLRSTPAEEKG